MKIDFSTPMTIYELLAIVLAAIAIIIPIGQAVFKKWIVKPKLLFFPTGRAMLFFNQSGSYIRIDGVYEAENKPISVKKISVKITRQKDDQKLNLSWSSFISPVNQNLVGNYLQTTESAHPFRIGADSISSAFTEFGDLFDSLRNSVVSAFSSSVTLLMVIPPIILVTPLFPVREDMPLNDGGVFADFDFSAPLRCLRLGVSHVGEEQSQPFALFAYGGFPRQDIENNHVAGFVHKALQRKDAVTADKIISVHIRHLAL